jgi:hypothetical protein
MPPPLWAACRIKGSPVSALVVAVALGAASPESLSAGTLPADAPYAGEPKGLGLEAAEDQRFALAALADADVALLPTDQEEAAQGLQNDAAEAPGGYSGDVFWNQAKQIPWRFGLATAAITATGLGNWNWGSSSFRFESEGYFGKKTASLGMDKLGHAWSTFVLTEFFTDGIEIGGGDRRHAPITGAVLAMGLMTYIEVFDGFSKDHGFSHEDLIVDAAGALLSITRRTVPGMRDLVDFRLLYTPDKSTLRSFKCLPKPFCAGDEGTNRSPITDYSNQRYLMAFKLSGIKAAKSTPLRFVELHTGYYARGFTAEDEERGAPLRRRLFVGVGINLNELFFPERPSRALGRGVKSVLEWVQIPYTAVHSH